MRMPVNVHVALLAEPQRTGDAVNDDVTSVTVELQPIGQAVFADNRFIVDVADQVRLTLHKHVVVGCNGIHGRCHVRRRFGQVGWIPLEEKILKHNAKPNKQCFKKT